MADRKEAEIHAMLLTIVRSIVDRPDEVEITVIPAEGCTTFRIKANPKDMGKIIGKQGHTARSIRTIVGASTMREGLGHTYAVDIVEGTPASDACRSVDSGT